MPFHTLAKHEIEENPFSSWLKKKVIYQLVLLIVIYIFATTFNQKA